MELLSKLEELINKLLTQLGELILMRLRKVIPEKVIKVWEGGFAGLKTLPKMILPFLTQYVKKLKETFLSIDFRAKLNETKEMALKQYREKKAKGTSKGKEVFLMPFLLIGQWVQGLSPAQTVLVLSFSVASLFAGVGIFNSSNRLLSHHLPEEQNRTPASADDRLEYDRPGYYKKQFRHLEVTNFRLPVYIGEVHELKSVDIDFIATLNTRHSRGSLEKLEFQLRDHLIRNFEPLVANFPLLEEGKSVIKEKLWLEINAFLKERKIEGEVEELKVIYILAN